MKTNCHWFVLLTGICLPALAGAQTGVTLVVKTDMNCNWKLDGQPMGLLTADLAKVVLVTPGEHLVEAATADGVATLHTKVEVGKSEKSFGIQLKRQHEDAAKDAIATVPAPKTWTDPATGLMWTKSDNKADVDWNQATAYCDDLRLGGFTGWRLPTLEELQGIYDASVTTRKLFDNTVTYSVHIKGSLDLSGWIWSSSLDGS